MGFAEEKEAIIGRLKRQPLLLSAEHRREVAYGREQVGQLLPHRKPFDFIDTIDAIDIPGQMIETTSIIADNDPVFAGHFPGTPLYPGVLQIEIMGQAALCLTHFVRQQSTEIAPDCRPIQCVFTRVHNAGFIQAVPPGAILTVRARVLESDDFIGVMAAQILIKEQICSHAVLEAHFL
jgi:3-hydroxymyristoyl/3-hydroxydecanoyl-(acyl carrier protein) dehydratase